MTFGDRIRELREQAGESLGHAAAQIGTTKPHLWQLERGIAANPTLKTLRGLSAHYGVSVAKIIGEV
jgi:transcriptional regulator with XRE-family HTH domain